MLEHGYRRQPLRSDVLLALLTGVLYVAATGRYGQRMLVALGVSAAVGVLTELAARRIRPAQARRFAFVYWMLYPLILPPAVPLWVVGVACFTGTLIGVVFFGGQGRQLIAPVAVGWAFAALSFPIEMSFGWALPFPGFAAGWERYAAGVLTVEHPINLLQVNPGVGAAVLVRGDFPQTPGNAVPAVLLAVGAAAMLLRAVDVRGAAAMVATAAGLTFLAHELDPALAVVRTLLVGNFLPAALLIYPDPRVAPRTFAGRWLGGALAGAVAFVIGSFGSSPGGALFAVLFAQTFSPLLDEAVLRVKYRQAVPA